MIKMTHIELTSYFEKLNNLESDEVLGGNSAYGGASRLELYRMIIKHDFEIYKTLNCLTYNAG